MVILTEPQKLAIFRNALSSTNKQRCLAVLARCFTVLHLMYLPNATGDLLGWTRQTVNVLAKCLEENAWK
jgi:hypothetical protein